MSKTVREALIECKELIGTPDKWCQGAFARDAKGDSVYIGSDAATQFCALGAVDRATRKYGMINAVITSLEVCLRDMHYREITDFNDTSTHQQVMELFDCAINKQGESEGQ